MRGGEEEINDLDKQKKVRVCVRCDPVLCLKNPKKDGSPSRLLGFSAAGERVGELLHFKSEFKI